MLIHVLTPLRRSASSDGPKVKFRSIHRYTPVDNDSGSGKTTLLNVLAHREAIIGASVSGQTCVNGAQSNPKDFHKLSSFVEQEDALVGSLTVKETLSFAARLALPRYECTDAAQERNKADCIKVLYRKRNE